MNTKTMEGLIGARTNMDLTDTPMRVFKEARRKGDTATMKRAMGYVGEFSEKAEEYKTKADNGMEEEAKEAREKAKLEREEAVRKRKEEREKLEERIEEDRGEETGTDTVEISEEGKTLLKDNIGPDHSDSVETKTDEAKESTIYTSTGEAAYKEQNVHISVSV